MSLLSNNRRSTLALLAASGASLLANRIPHAIAAAPPSMCVLTPAQTEGPFFVDAKLNRSDIRTDPTDGNARDGVPLTLNLTTWISSANGCTPIAGTLVDIWHCDALGVYSGTGGARTAFLRGQQVSDSQGRVAFRTIYPGGYEGRAVHIHVKIRGRNAAGRGFELTTQLYFDDAVTDRVHTRQPYAARGVRALRNERDFAFRNGGSRLMLSLAENAGSYVANFDVALAV